MKIVAVAVFLIVILLIITERVNITPPQMPEEMDMINTADIKQYLAITILNFNTIS